VELRQQMGVTFPMIRENIGFKEGFGMTMYPTTVFIDRTGKILKIDVGGYKSEQELIDIIERYL
jgi:thioredoxin-related protein